MAKEVAIFGGGIGGLSAAHELLERGFSVKIYERQSIPGGKARSFPYDVTERSTFFGSADVKIAEQHQTAQRVVMDDEGEAASAQIGLPAEHGFRFFPGFYRHITDTMSRIPRLDGKGKVADDLVRASELGIVRDHGHVIRVPTQAFRGPKEIRKLLTEVENAETGLTYDDLVQFTSRIWQILTSCEARRISEYERIGWWRFIDGDNQTRAFQRYFGNLTRSLVAAHPRLASTRTNGDILVQLLIDIFYRLSHPDQILNGPTNEVWIHPWIQHLRSQYGDKFEYYLDTSVTGFDYDQKSNRITSAKIAITEGGPRNYKRIESCDRHRVHCKRVELESDVVADYYISAIPVERMAPLVTAEMEVGDPNLRWLKYLEDSVEWMNGIVFFLKEDIPIAHGHVLYVDPGSALTSISQAQFWKNVDLAQYGRGDVAATLSVDISDWSELLDDDLESIPLTVWRQLQHTLNSNGDAILADENVLYAALDPSIREFHQEQRRILKPDGSGKRSSREDIRKAKVEIVHNIRSLVNAEPLLVNSTDSWRLRPYPDSRIQNLFLASDYVRTNTDLATMEGANEAARRAVNAILGAEKSRAKPAALWSLRRVAFLAPLRWWDRRRFNKGLPWRDPLPWLPNLVPPVWKLACLVFRVKKAPSAKSDPGAAGQAPTSAQVGT
jgi:uncharacterized protein with NAD-binding domain and iron-sulfur cluster